jgi:Dyp-type peroxidase family
MQAEIIVKGKSLGGSSDLTLLAPIKQGFIESLETVTYKTRIKKVLQALHASRQSSHEYATARLLSDSIERVGVIQSVRVAVLEPEDKVLLVVTFDGSWESYIRVLWHKVGTLLDLIFCSTEDYVTAHDHSFQEWLAWAKRVQVESHFFYGSPEFTVQDALFHKRAEQNRLQGFDTPLDEVRMALPSAEDFAQNLDFQSYTKIPNQELRIPYERFKVGFSALARVYRLVDLFLPNTKDGVVLRLASLNLLSDFIPFWLGADRETLNQIKGIKDLRLSRQIDWITNGNNLPQLPTRAKPEPDYNIKSIENEIQGGLVETYSDSTHGVLVMLAFANSSACKYFFDKFRKNISTQAGASTTGIHYNLSFTLDGLRVCGVSQQTLELFPEDFRQGMAARAGLLGDVRHNHPKRWRSPPAFTGHTTAPDASRQIAISSVHAVLQLRINASNNPGAAQAVNYWDNSHPLQQEINKIAQFEKKGIKVLAVQSMKRQFKDFNFDERIVRKPTEHFGYADGASDLQFEKNAPKENIASLGEVLLGHNNAADDDEYDRKNTIYLKQMEWLRNGSFMVIRKYRQYVDRFENAVSTAATHLSNEKMDDDSENHEQKTKWAKNEIYGKLMGRYQNGLALAQTQRNQDLNAFNYATDPKGQNCPLHAHIRRANPRFVKGEMARPPRLARRSMSYGSAYAEETRDEDRGLVFMAYNASLSEQFETVQRWLSGGNSTGASSGVSCPIVGVPENGFARHFRFESAVSAGKSIAFNMALEEDSPLFTDPLPYTQLEWGMYLFTPSMGVLKKIHALTELANKKEPACINVPWSLTRGREILARLKHIEQSLPSHCALGSWKAAIEDPEAIDSMDSAALWAAIRADHGGLLRTSYGVLVADRELVKKVYMDADEQYSVSGQMARMKEVIGPIALGKDMGAEYRREADPINAAIMSIKPEDVYTLSYKAADSHLNRIIELAVHNAELGTSENFEVTVDARELLTEVLADLSENWFGIQNSAQFARGSADLSWQNGDKPIYPGHFTALSRYMFQPNPSKLVKDHAKDYGNSLRDAMFEFVKSRNGKIPQNSYNLDAPIAKAIFEHNGGNTIKNNPKFVADTMVGVLMGFTPTIIGAVLNVLKEWHTDHLFDSLKNELDKTGKIIKEYAEAKSLIREPMEHASQMRPMPQIGWRTVIKDHRLGNDLEHAIDLKVDEVVVMSMVSATQQSLEDGKNDGRLMFGGIRERQNNFTQALEKHPTHACPGYHAGIAAMLGIIAVLLNRKGLKQGESAGTFDITDSILKEQEMNGLSNNVAELQELVLRYQYFIDYKQLAKNTQDKWSEINQVSKGNLCAWGDSWVTNMGVKDALINDCGYQWNINADSVSNFCSPGAWIQDMAKSCDQNQGFLKYLKDTVAKEPLPKAIILSGGGNDSIRGVLSILSNPKGSSQTINQPQLDSHLDKKIIPSYEEIIKGIEIVIANKKIPIVIHGYDFAIPFTSKNGLINLYSKEWLRKPLLSELKYDRDEGAKIMEELLQQLNTKLRELASRHPDNVVYVDLKKTLEPKWDDERVAAWRDNMHPNEKGKLALAKKIASAIDDWHKKNS